MLSPTPNSSKVLAPISERRSGENRPRHLFFFTWPVFWKRLCGNGREATGLRVLSLTLRLSSWTQRAAAVAHAALTSCWAPAPWEKRIQSAREEEVRKRGRLLRGIMKRCREAGNVPLHRPGHKQAIRGVFVLFIGRRHIYNK